jgi:hypothetical protein
VQPAAQAPTLGVPRQYVPADWTVDEPSWEDALPPGPAPHAPAAPTPPGPAAFPVAPAAQPVGFDAPVENGWPVDVPVLASAPAAGQAGPAAAREVPAPALTAPSLTAAGLVRRVPLANLAPQMTGIPVAPALPADSVAMPAPERARSLLSTYRDGLTLGRAEAPVARPEPADSDPANPGAPA